MSVKTNNKKIVRRTPTASLSFSDNHLHPILQRIYTHRGITQAHELQNELDQLLRYDDLLNVHKAAELIANTLQQQQSILIVGDFDADGATSTALAVSALKTFGAKQVDFLVPNRFAFGYGLTPELVAVAKERNPHLIITVDNGIANHAGVLAAKNAGINVLITDHHLSPETLPNADVIVNPNQPDDKFLSKNLAGVGVIFYVMCALRKYLRECNWFTQQNIPEPNMAQFLDLVALGTVADVVALDHNNRILVAQGLKRIRAGLARDGIQALLQISQRDAKKITASDLGFAVGPRLNAAGRLDDMSLGIDCLLSTDFIDALKKASVLDQFNQERRSIENTMQQQAQQLLQQLHLDEEKLPPAICLFDPSWHQGVIGVLAGRLKELHHRPTIIFAKSNDDEIKGSARSITGLHIRDLLAELDAQHPNIITKFGGHAMAAGLTIPLAHFEKFNALFQHYAQLYLTRENINLDEQTIWSDGTLSDTEFDLTTAAALRSAGPWGQHFPEPLFDGNFSITNQRLINDKHLKLWLRPENTEKTIEAIFFRQESLLPQENVLRFAYRLDINDYQGKQQLQLIIEHWEIP